MTLFEKIKIKIKKDCQLDVCDLERTYASKNQIESWAWTWSGSIKGNPVIRVGSWMTIKELLKCDKLKVNKTKWLMLEITG